MRKVFGYEVAVVDLTAGDGSLIAKFDMKYRYGVEIDPDQTMKGNYKAITGDMQKVYPLFRELGFKADTIAINPPFGLAWTDTEGKRVNSTLLCYRYAIELLASFGQGVMICGWERYLREVAQMPENEYIYAVIHCEDMFDNADIPVALCFFTKHVVEKPAMSWFKSDRVGLPEMDGKVIDAREKLIKAYISSYTAENAI